MYFQTKRLEIREFLLSDADDFFDIMGNPNVANPVPAKVLSRIESDALLHEFNKSNQPDKVIRAIILRKSGELVGLCGLIKNDEKNDELAYRLREQFWGVGYATEITKGMIRYCFEELNLDLITADVSVSNTKSAKILDKFLNPVKEFYNEKDKEVDRRYHLTKEEWIINTNQ